MFVYKQTTTQHPHKSRGHGPTFTKSAAVGVHQLVS